MKFISNWHVLHNGSGSVSGNDWIEEVCYLGQERWLLSLRDDSAWSIGEVDVQEPEERTSANLAKWVQKMDSNEDDEKYSRVQELNNIAREVGATECSALTLEFLQSREGDS